MGIRIRVQGMTKCRQENFESQVHRGQPTGMVRRTVFSITPVSLGFTIVSNRVADTTRFRKITGEYQGLSPQRHFALLCPASVACERAWNVLIAQPFRRHDEIIRAPSCARFFLNMTQTQTSPPTNQRVAGRTSRPLLKDRTDWKSALPLNDR